MKQLVFAFHIQKLFSWKDILLYSLLYSWYSINLVELIGKEQYK